MSRSSSADQHESPEESSWTMYFEDFSNQNHIDHMNRSTSINLSNHINHQTSSLIPDAACSAAGRHVLGASLDHKNSKSLSFKKRNVKRSSSSSSGFVDHDLEDTATSPANSPKVCNSVKQLSKQKGAMGMSHEIKGSASGKINGDELVLNGGESVGSKKKSLCLVPLSMFVHYLG